MSLDKKGERLLAEALADALDWDLEEVPSQEALEDVHSFSKGFERSMRRMERTLDGRAQRPAAVGRRIGAWAAALVCVVGLAAVAALGGLSHKAAGDSAFTGDAGFAELEAADDADGAASGAAADGAPEEAETEGAAEQNAYAPDWQEQLLAESAYADKAVDWQFDALYEDGVFKLYTCVKEAPERQLSERRVSYRISNVYAVYYEQAPDDWTRVYYTSERAISFCSKDTEQGELYELSKLHMTRAGAYRLVRQVDGWRQVLQVSLTRAGTEP